MRFYRVFSPIARIPIARSGLQLLEIRSRCAGRKWHCGSFLIRRCLIQASAGALVDNLMRAQPSYIRTIKSNENRSPTEYDSKAILHQIKYLGLQENIRVRRAGFAYRNTFEKMIERFYLLSPATSYAGDYIWTGNARSGCEKILTDTGIAKEEWQMGVTKAFIKNPETVRSLSFSRGPVL